MKTKTKLSTALSFLGAFALSSSLSGCGHIQSTKRYPIENVHSETERILGTYFTKNAKRKLSGIPVEVINAPYQITTGPVQSSRHVSAGIFGIATLSQRTSGLAVPICPGQKYCGHATMRDGKIDIQLINNPCCVQDRKSLDRIMVHEYLHAATFNGMINMSEFKSVFNEFRENLYSQLSGSIFLVNERADASSNEYPNYDDHMWLERIAVLGEKAIFDGMYVPDSVKRFYSKVLKKYSVNR